MSARLRRSNAFLGGKVKSAVPGERRPDPQTAAMVVVVGLAHEDSGRSVIAAVAAYCS